MFLLILMDLVQASAGVAGKYILNEELLPTPPQLITGKFQFQKTGQLEIITLLGKPSGTITLNPIQEVHQ